MINSSPGSTNNSSPYFKSPKSSKKGKFPPLEINAKKLEINYLHTTWFENVNGKFLVKSLPIQSDFSPVYAISANDFNGDGNIGTNDLLVILFLSISDNGPAVPRYFCSLI